MLRVRELQEEDRRIKEGIWHLTPEEKDEHEKKKRELAILTQKLKEEEEESKAAESYHFPTCLTYLLRASLTFILPLFSRKKS